MEFFFSGKLHIWPCRVGEGGTECVEEARPSLKFSSPGFTGCAQDPHPVHQVFLPGLISISAEAALPCRGLTRSNRGCCWTRAPWRAASPSVPTSLPPLGRGWWPALLRAWSTATARRFLYSPPSPQQTGRMVTVRPHPARPTGSQAEVGGLRARAEVGAKIRKLKWGHRQRAEVWGLRSGRLRLGV